MATKRKASKGRRATTGPTPAQASSPAAAAPAPATGAAQVSGTTSLDVAALRELVGILEASAVTRLEWERGEERLSIRRGGPVSRVAHPVAAPAAGPAQVAEMPLSPRPGYGEAVPAPEIPAPAPEKPGVLVTSPFVGTFYRSPSPDQPSFVEVGQIVRKGQVLCIVEAMKLMNEIEADAEGRVAEVLVENGQPVEFGQPLFRLERV
jgi:acetyl-CoA carboxylase biotin carboxyl carrier protein